MKGVNKPTLGLGYIVHTLVGVALMSGAFFLKRGVWPMVVLALGWTLPVIVIATITLKALRAKPDASGQDSKGGSKDA